MTKPIRKANKLPTDAEVARKVQIAFEEIFAPFIVPGPGAQPAGSHRNGNMDGNMILSANQTGREQ